MVGEEREAPSEQDSNQEQNASFDCKEPEETQNEKGIVFRGLLSRHDLLFRFYSCFIRHCWFGIRSIFVIKLDELPMKLNLKFS